MNSQKSLVWVAFEGPMARGPKDPRDKMVELRISTPGQGQQGRGRHPWSGDFLPKKQSLSLLPPENRLSRQTGTVSACLEALIPL
jgi:hypothetical protein